MKYFRPQNHFFGSLVLQISTSNLYISIQINSRSHLSIIQLYSSLYFSPFLHIFLFSFFTNCANIIDPLQQMLPYILGIEYNIP